MSTSLNANISPELTTKQGRAVLTKQVEELGEWFHNIDLFGVPTATQPPPGQAVGPNRRQVGNAAQNQKRAQGGHQLRSAF